MKLLRYGPIGYEKVAISINNKIYDLSHQINDISEKSIGSDWAKFFDSLDLESLNEVKNFGRIGAPVGQIGKIICIGLNYRKHAEESGMDTPIEPVVFFKATSSVVGPFDNIIIPKGSEKTDWEVELAVVIGKKASYVSKEDAMDYVAGYCLHNDVSERAFQLERGGQWVKGKSCDTFAPIGPYLITKDEVANPNNLKLWLKLNGKVMQEGSTNDFIFKIDEIVSYLSQFMSLQPGDIISTGTPSGVGLGQQPPLYLKHGDVVELGIDGLCQSRQEVIAYEAERKE